MLLETSLQPMLLAKGEHAPTLMDPLQSDLCEGTLQALARTVRRELERRCPWAGIVEIPGQGSVQVGLVLSKRPENVLRRHGITTIGKLIGMTKSELLDLPGAGRRVVREIEAELATLGLALRPEPLSYGL